jgi:hypothetical protein
MEVIKMDKITKTNIINFLNWNDKNANIDMSYSSRELLALFIYELNYSVLECHNWIDLLEYSTQELMESMDDITLKAYEILNKKCTQKDFKEILKFVK